MFLRRLVNSGNIPLCERVLAFTHARHQVLTENVANADTPGYRTKRLDAATFQRALRRAISDRGRSGSAALVLPDTRQFRSDRGGRLTFTPVTEPTENLLFHDGTNMRIERQMAAMAENAMAHQVTVELLKGAYDALNSAVRGRVS